MIQALTKKQVEVLALLFDKQTDEILFGGGAGGAKSFVGCYWLFRVCMKYPGTRYLMGRSKLKALKETTLNTFFEVLEKLEFPSSHYNYNQQSGTITFYNGSQIILKDLFSYPSDPNFDSLGSLEITGAFIDECNQISEKAWNIVKSRIRYKIDQNGLIPKILGTCNPAKNWVYSRFYLPWSKGDLPTGRVFIQSLLTDNPFISSHYKKNLLTLDQASKERLLKGNWNYDNDPSALINFESIANSFSNDFLESGAKHITADIARFGTDRTVIGFWNGFRLEHIKVMDKNDIPGAAKAIQEFRQKYKVPLSHVVVDEDGVGGGVVDILKCRGFVANSRPVGKDQYANLKSQCYFSLAERVNANEYYFNIEDTEVRQMLTEELEQVKQAQVDSDKKLKVVPKDDVKEMIGRSPDFSDMVMMREYFEVKPKKKAFL